MRFSIKPFEKHLKNRISKFTTVHHFIIIILIYSLPRVPYLFMPHWNLDEGVYLSVASDLNRGSNLYFQSWDHKPPLIYWVYAWLLNLSGNQYWIIPLTNFFLGLITIFLIYKISRYFSSSQKSFTATYLAAIFLGLGIYEAATFNGENLFIPLTLASIYFFLCSSLKYRDYLAGLLAFLGTLVKIHPGVELFGFFLGYLTTQNGENLSFKILRLIKVAGIGALGWLSVLGYFNYKGYLSFALLSMFGYNSEYVSFENQGYAELFSTPIFGLTHLYFRGLILLLSVVFLWFLNKEKLIPSKISILSFWFIFGVFAVLISGRNYGHYFLQLVPTMMISFGVIWETFEKKLKPYFKLSSIKTLILGTISWALIIQFISLIFNYSFSSSRNDILPPNLVYLEFTLNYFSNNQKQANDLIWKYAYRFYPEIWDIVHQVKKNTENHQRIWHFSNLSAFCYYVERKCGYTSHLWFHLSPEIKNRTLKELEDDKPEMIFVDNFFVMPEEISEFIESNYSKKTVINDVFEGYPRFEFWYLEN